MLERYLEKAYDEANEVEKIAFERLLDLQDPQLLNYLLGREQPIDRDLANIVARIRSISPF